MSLFDAFLDVLSLVSVQRHKHELAAVRRNSRMALEELRESSRTQREEVENALHRDAEVLKANAEASYRRGFAEGREFERLEHAERIRAAAEESERKEREAARERAKWVVSPTPIGFTSQIRDEFMRDVEARVEYPPQPQQWKMILADDPATYVIAGAGSGKSSSLVLRVIALNLYREIDRSRISVFTFTKDSRADFVKKLRESMKKWGVDLSETDARSIVRTFHSMVLKMARQSMSPPPKVLELLDRERKGPVRDVDVENFLELSEEDELEDESEQEATSVASRREDIVDDSPDTHKLDDLLRIAYERAFSRNEEFHGLVVKLFKQRLTLTRRATDKSTQGNIAKIAKVDKKMTEALDIKWSAEVAPGVWPLPGIVAETTAISVSSQFSQEFWVNGYVPQIGAHIVLGGAQFYKGTSFDDVPSAGNINTKRKLLAGISEKPIVWIDDLDQLTALRATLKWLADDEEKRSEVLMFNMIAPGEFKSKSIVKGFHGLAQFVENLGLPVADTLSSAKATKDNNLGRDIDFMRATALFWPYFEAVLEERGICTFNQLFARFSEDNPENFSKVSSQVLGAMRHLMIDEFQDVSPQIVKWVRGCQKELVKRGMAGSLTCVGDDYQSIYGWRGSSPEFFVRFKDSFPAISHGKILLEENFRSSDRILRCAESVLAGVPGMESKTCRAKGEWADSATPVRIFEAKKDLPYAEIRQHISSEIERTKASESHPMLVLARSRAVLTQLSGSPNRSWGKKAKLMTIHGSKGLEAQSVVLLGDCNYDGTNPVKNFLYAQAGLGSYDEAQRAEARRLAYVGVTRAMESCTWYAAKKDGGAIGSIPKGAVFAEFARLDPR
ncbi:UvrD-helicase domain-containing protein [Pseudoduganella sp. R-34]|uniref:UvrD-helicase domain-containing protein n=1 Tax=Pseudoduganella sp. R-34 TaxID=3404062 RepID=UPI003CF13A4A